MFLTKRRAILIGAVAAIAAGIILTPLILTFTLPPDINAVKINLDKVEIENPSPEEETANLLTFNVFFKVDNPTDKTLTTSKIDYTLLANGESLGNGHIDYVDIPVHGRPQLLSGSEATIKSKFEIPRNDPSLTQINLGNLTSSDINWEVEGTADIESGFVTAPLVFKDELQRSP
jgi:LEA14-like dessication related protein